MRATYAFSLVCIESYTQRLVTNFLNTLAILNCKSLNTSCTLSIAVSCCAVLRHFLTNSIKIKVISREAVNANSLFGMALTIDINCSNDRGSCILRTYSCIRLSIIRSLLFGTWAIDWFIRLISVAFLTISTVAFFIPYGTMFDNFHTNVFPFGTTLETLKTSSCGLIEIFAVYFELRSVFLQHSELVARDINC